jgi:hypothetical protein
MAGINPLLIVNVLVNGEKREKDFLLEEDCELFLFGPLAGG